MSLQAYFNFKSFFPGRMHDEKACVQYLKQILSFRGWLLDADTFWIRFQVIEILWAYRENAKQKIYTKTIRDLMLLSFLYIKKLWD